MRSLALAAALGLALSACGGSESEPAAPADAGATCTPRAGADEAFAALHDPASPEIEKARALAARYMADHPPEGEAWDWGEGVLMQSLVDLYRVTGDEALADYYRAWIDHYLGIGYRELITTSDRCPPAVTALELYADTCDARYRAVVDDTLTYLYDEAVRTDDGGINHLGTIDALGVSLWVDSLFMFGNVLTRSGEHFGDARALDEMHDQLTIFASHLQDESGWLTHAFGWGAAQDPDVFWGRGNSWVTMAGYEYLRVRKARGETDPEVEAILAAQVEAIVAAQDPDTGLYWTVLNRPGETYLETSASALFAAGLARGYRQGFLGESVLPTIEAAMAGVGTKIVGDPAAPTVSGTSGPTTVGTFDKYAAVPQEDGIHYGVGAVIFALVETSGM